MRLILASTSSARRVLMDALGVPFVAESPGVDETVPAAMPAREAVALLAERKAAAVRARHPESDWVLGADQLVDLDGRKLGKPADREAARAQLKPMLGRSHRLTTGVCLLGPQFREVLVDEVRLEVYPLSDEELDRYLDLGEWEGCAGSYRIEGRGAALFSRIDGDRTSIQGLPMIRVVALLRRAGFRFFE